MQTSQSEDSVPKMSQESQDQHRMKEETVEIELEPRAVTQAVTAPEAGNDIAKPCSPQADNPNSNDQIGAASSQNPGSIAQSAESSPDENCVLGRQGQEAEGLMGSPSHMSHEVINDNVNIIEQNDKAILSKTRDLLLSGPQRARQVEDNRRNRGLEPGWTQYMFQDGNRDALRRIWQRSSFIHDNWPETRNIAGNVPGEVGNSYSASRRRTRGKIIYCASNTFQKVVQGFPISLLACALSFEEPFRLSGTEMRYFYVPKSISILSTDFRGGYSVQSEHDLHNTIHWQIRYFSPTSEPENRGIDCLLGERQTVILQHGSEETILQEKRAVVSFRVLREAPELFSILVLQDEDLCPDTQSPNQKFDVNMFWKGCGFVDPDQVNPLTFYLIEICRVLKKCMDAWGETLSTIDKLVHVKLEDLDNQEKVEELMFDNSFQRSKDYFVALQILRIIDEWLDEVQSTVADMFQDPVLLKTSRWADGHIETESFQAAIRYVSEHATATKSRVRKKHDEINSLRDGLFNATSLRESTKAMALNQAIYVFTVVTVLFTPVSFLATFWALPFLNNPTEGSDTIPEPSAFRNSFIIMPILTYALVIGVAWFVGRRNSARALLDLLRRYWRILR
ncbi:hypothetical protein LB504_002026 [Fusarium proliferatum]|nr:hypothetical protein LB504_002026 [Fusarium proliferatum]